MRKACGAKIVPLPSIQVNPESGGRHRESPTKPSMTVAAWQMERSDLGHSDQPGQTVARGNVAPCRILSRWSRFQKESGVCSLSCGGGYPQARWCRWIPRRCGSPEAASLSRATAGRDSPVSHGFDDWLLLQRTRVAEVIAEMLRRIAAAAHIVSDDFHAAAVTAASLVALDPLDAAMERLRTECPAKSGYSAILSLRAQQFRRCERREAASRREHALYSCQPREIASLRQQEASRHGRARPGPYA